MNSLVVGQIAPYYSVFDLHPINLKNHVNVVNLLFGQYTAIDKIEALVGGNAELISKKTELKNFEPSFFSFYDWYDRFSDKISPSVLEKEIFKNQIRRENAHTVSRNKEILENYLEVQRCKEVLSDRTLKRISEKSFYKIEEAADLFQKKFKSKESAPSIVFTEDQTKNALKIKQVYLEKTTSIFDLEWEKADLNNEEERKNREEAQ